MVNLTNLLLVFFGGGIGSLLRYLIGIFMLSNAKLYFPLGTFAVNLIGCFILGLIIGFIENKQNLSPEVGILLGTGFCGGFTTFSTFSIESTKLIEDGEWMIFLGYTVGSVALGLLLGMLGIRITR